MILGPEKGTLSICTGHTGSESNKCNRIDAVFEVDEAAKVASDISDDSGTGANHEDWNNKSGVAIGQSCKKRGRALVVRI